VISSQIELIPISSIIVPRTERQRRNLPAIEELAGSIGQHGLFCPVVVSDSLQLIQGECRLSAFKHLQSTGAPCTYPEYDDWTLIPGRRAHNITEQEQHLLELEENIKRTDLTWQDASLAVVKFHEIAGADPSWTTEQTANALGWSKTNTVRYLQVGRELAAGNEAIKQASGVVAAYNVMQRKMERALAFDVEQIILPGPEGESEAPHEEGLGAQGSSPSALPFQILNEDFLTFSAAETFNLIHCDFPYGIGWDKAKKGTSSGQTKAGVYEDSPEVARALMDALIDSRLVSSSAHIVFWTSAAIPNLNTVRNYFLNRWDCRVDQFPLIWHRTDGAGMVSDITHSGRRTYEAALLITRGDRPLISPKAMSYGSPSARATRIHSSEKPEPMLRHFLSMLVDEYTSILDPTCGSGTALRAALALGAARGVGLEVNPEYATPASEELERAIRLKAMQ